MKRIKVVIFDAYGTFFDVNPAVKKISVDTWVVPLVRLERT